MKAKKQSPKKKARTPKAAKRPVKRARPAPKKGTARTAVAPKPKKPAVKPIMSKADLNYFEDLIAKKREEVARELGYMEKASLSTSAKEASGDLSSYSFHMADQASDSEEMEHNFKLAEREGQFLHHLEEALYRIKEGTFGICRSCNGPIGKERLEAVPHATMCIKCKAADQERRRKEGE